MQDFTISMDDALAVRARAEARRVGKSVSDFLSDAVTKIIAETPELNEQQKALERIFAGPMWDVTENGRMPTSEERNARR